MRKFRFLGRVDIDGILVSYEDGVLIIIVFKRGFYIGLFDLVDRLEVIVRVVWMFFFK